MFDLLVRISRYLFIFYIALFLWQSFVYIMNEQGKKLGNPKQAVSIQRIIIMFLHITAFLILAYKPGEFSFDVQALFVGGGGLIFLATANFAIGRVYKQSCPIIWNSMFFLLDTGLIMIQRLDPRLASKQLIWMAIGFFIMLLIPFVLRMIPRFEVFENLYIILSIALIASTLFLGSKEYGSLNWIYIGVLSLQPSEIVKFLFIFYIASVFRRKVQVKELIITAVLSSVIVLLLVVQKDLGGALIFFMTYMIMLYIATSNSYLFIGGMGAATIGAMIAYKLFNHVRVRVAVWQNPWRDIDSGGYQIVQSLFAVSTWGFLGSGLTKGMPQVIPVAAKDFIFSAICEEFGSLFGIGIVCIFIVIFYRGIKIALNCKRRYYSLLAAGFISMFAFQAFLILGGVIKLIPLTGVTLPFISYGGSSIFVSIMMIGILQWINVYYERYSVAGGEELE